ncbi:GNAT family N-acetyltransferase [Pseudoflavonifractor sp. 524-17]|uniref:GNAT family N-acetyltransferase n=1 Tax=Pseudoflavonifractor sp. 524-17 TaxID=2304577 RepID=UPI00137A6A96|nr:GNAT family N-acetyltransferase [Pseudoflavonifractor sp. 524-17]NCE64765.1 GNAT family N-acetyltransferase [Pseudoflavonifractor sp. 524-17]
MIRAMKEQDLTAVMQIWYDTNVKAHCFIPEEYWAGHFPAVKDQLPQAEIYVFENDNSDEIDGFIGLTGSYIAGIFVKEAAQSRGIGAQLLNYAKQFKTGMELSVYQKNTQAVRFYQREQFMIQSEQIDDSTGEREFIMAWTK